MPVMEQEALEAHFRSLVPDRGDLLKRLEKEAAERDIPIVGPSMGNLLYLLTLISGSQKVLELGTAIGYSTLWIAKASRVLQGRIHTYENDATLAKEAQKNFKEAGFSDLVTVHEEDIATAIPSLADSYSLIFVDMDKELYEPILHDLVDLLKPRGLIVADNASFEEVKGFNQKLAELDGFDCAFLHGFFAEHSPERDGLAIARKRVS